MFTLEIVNALSGREKNTPLAELDGTDRTPSRLGSATPTGRFTAAAAANPWRTRGEPFTTRRVPDDAAQQPPRDGSRLLAVTWRLDDWRRVDGVRRSPRFSPASPFSPCLFSFVRLPSPPLSSRPFLLLLFLLLLSPSPLVHLSICSSMYVRA